LRSAQVSHPAGHGSASPLVGPAAAGTITPLMGPAAPATVIPLLGPADRGTMASLMGPRRPGHGHAADAPKPVMPRSDRKDGRLARPGRRPAGGPGRTEHAPAIDMASSDPQVVRPERR
jgi:hypothetical protein